VSPEVQDIGISRYALYEVDSLLYKYKLEFTNTKGWGFRFWLQGGDGEDALDCLTVFDRDHYVEFNSNRAGPPVIERVKEGLVI